MTIKFHFEFKGDEYAEVDDIGVIVAAQADLVGVDDADNIRHAVTIRIDAERGTMDPPPNDGTMVPVAELTHETMAAWLIAALKAQDGPRDSGDANMYAHYRRHIAEMIPTIRERKQAPVKRVRPFTPTADKVDDIHDARRRAKTKGLTAERTPDAAE